MSSRFGACIQAINGNEHRENSVQNKILKYYKKFLTFEESTYFSVEVAKRKKSYENMSFEERLANANSA